MAISEKNCGRRAPRRFSLAKCKLDTIAPHMAQATFSTALRQPRLASRRVPRLTFSSPCPKHNRREARLPQVLPRTGLVRLVFDRQIFGSVRLSQYQYPTGFPSHRFYPRQVLSVSYLIVEFLVVCDCPNTNISFNQLQYAPHFQGMKK